MAHRVVILGGGFGGLYAARALQNAAVEVTVVDRRNFHLFQPLLYQVATGSLAPGEIASPIRALLRGQSNARVILGEAKDLDTVGRRLILADGQIPYDTLIVATGAKTHYFGHDEWEKTAPGLKSVEDATRIRHNIYRAFEAAERETDAEARRAWLTFVVVGAGPTGVELAGALAEIANDALKYDFRNIRTEDSQILLLDGGSRVLSAYPKSLSHEAERALIKLGVRPRAGTSVSSIDAGGVEYTLQNPDGSKRTDRIAARTVIWAAGVAASGFGKVLERTAKATLDRAGQVEVSPDLCISGHPEIFVIGDLARAKDPDNGNALLPGIAPVAMQQGRYVAKVIQARLAGKTVAAFHYSDRGNLAVIGRNAAVGVIKGRQVKGRVAWLAWLFIHLMFLSAAFNRILVLIRWGYQFVTFNRSSRLITGDGDES